MVDTSPRRPRRSPLASWWLLALPIALVLVAWWLTRSAVERRADERFRFEVDRAAESIDDQMADYELALRGASGLVDASEAITRDEWRRYVARLDLGRRLTGIEGVGLARWLAPGDVSALERAQHDDGRPGFTVWPAAPDPARSAVVLLEPEHERNLHAIAFDMWSEPVRREAMQRAADTGEPALSGPVKLVQETTTGQSQVGLLLYLPVYRRGAVPGDAQARRAALYGWVYAPLRTSDLMQSILPGDATGLALAVFDGEVADGSLLYRTPDTLTGHARHAERVLPMYGRRWVLQANALPALEATVGSSIPALILVTGATIDAMLAALIIAHRRQRRQLLAMTRAESALKARDDALQRSERRFRVIVEGASEANLLVDARGKVTLVNRRTEAMLRADRSELLGRSVESLLPERFRTGHPGLRERFFSDPQTRPMGQGRDLFARRLDGSEFPVEIALNPVETDEGPQVLATITDITGRKATEAATEAALREKTVLLNEVHHRVKNNLQVITSLLNLQARSAPPEAREVLGVSRDRIRAMGLMHQLLYERQDFSRLHLGQYLEQLARLLRETHDETRVRLTVDGVRAPIELDLQRAVPCGLLVNELVTNAYKHAFPDGRRGTVTIALSEAAPGQAELTVTDDGIGLDGPPDFEGSASLGFQLVPLLVDQLHGRLELRGPPGTCFAIRFAAFTDAATEGAAHDGTDAHAATMPLPRERLG